MAPVRTPAKARRKHAAGRASTEPTDAILPLHKPYMDQILTGEKTHEFRKYLIRPSVKRVWFYLSAPVSGIKYVCEIWPAQTRGPGDAPLEENGVGNREFNERHKDWDGYDFAYRIASVYELHSPIGLKTMKDKYGFKGAPRGMVYLPEAIQKDVIWDNQKRCL